MQCPQPVPSWPISSIDCACHDTATLLARSLSSNLMYTETLSRTTISGEMTEKEGCHSVCRACAEQEEAMQSRGGAQGSMALTHSHISSAAEASYDAERSAS